MRLLARLISSSPLLVLVIWLVLTVLSMPFAAKAPALMTAKVGSTTPGSEAVQLNTRLADEFGEKNTNTVLLISHSQPSLKTDLGKQQYRQFLDGLRQIEGVHAVLPPREGSKLSGMSDDGVRALALVQIPLEDGGGSDTLQRVRDYTAQHNTAQQNAAQNDQNHSKLTVRVTGGQAIADDFAHFAEQDTKHSEMMALPLIAVMLLLVFGALVATGLPIVVGLMSITLSMAVLYGLTFVMPVNTFTQSIVTMLGLGAGIDYALLMVNRFREELTRRSAKEAAAATVLTAGRSVLFSGATVALALAGLLIPSVEFLRSIGLGGVLVVLLTVLASITALPALLCVLGERVNSPRFFSISWARSGKASERWTAFARRVTARPLVAVLGTSVLLLTLSLPAFRMQTGYAGAWGLTPGVESRDALAEVRSELGAGGLLSQYEVLLSLGRKYQVSDAQMLREITAQLEALEQTKIVLSPFMKTNSLSLSEQIAIQKRSWTQNKETIRMTVIPKDNLRSDKARLYEREIRSILSASLNNKNISYLVGGAPVAEREWAEQIMNALPMVVGFVVVGTFFLLMIAFRSLLIPLKSIVLNLATVLAAIGVVTQIVQFGTFASFLGIPLDVGLLDATLPVMLFTVMFGLSMDYEIFLLSRIQEEHLSGKNTVESVVKAVGHTARIITSAAIIMFIVFGAFVFGRVVTTKSIGMGLAAAVFLDATLVRLILVPAFMIWAGRWNWWLPSWLDKRLPYIRLEH